jgi:hypothetical protein
MFSGSRTNYKTSESGRKSYGGSFYGSGYTYGKTYGGESSYRDESSKECIKCGIELVSRDISDKKSYNKFALKYHPDKKPDDADIDDTNYYQESFNTITDCYNKFYGDEPDCDINIINNVKTNYRHKESINNRRLEIGRHPSEQKILNKINERRKLSEERKKNETRKLSEERKENERRKLSEERKENEKRKLSEERKENERQQRKYEAFIKQKQADDDYKKNQEEIKNKIKRRSALKIQSAYKRHLATKELQNRKLSRDRKLSEERKKSRASVKIQSAYKRYRELQNRKLSRDRKLSEEREEIIRNERPIMMNKNYEKILKDVVKTAKEFSRKQKKRNFEYKSRQRQFAEIVSQAAAVGKTKFKSPKKYISSPKRPAIKRKRKSSSESSITKMLEKLTIENNSGETSPKKKKLKK